MVEKLAHTIFFYSITTVKLRSKILQIFEKNQEKNHKNFKLEMSNSFVVKIYVLRVDIKKRRDEITLFRLENDDFLTFPDASRPPSISWLSCFFRPQKNPAIKLH